MMHLLPDKGKEKILFFVFKIIAKIRHAIQNCQKKSQIDEKRNHIGETIKREN